jgi:hypothetical protein
MSKKKWGKLPIMCWSLTLYKEDEKGNQKFYEYNGDHSFVSEGIDNEDLREISEEEK